ncbi:oligosaccharide flippase family protein [Afifella sp. H1R]|uniref:oligosaccharide flippase family protein n=1 Tax=Afifella sp. H1R TaxID=2908841 RepID=UPI001F3FC522|nr:oligosaccharide flippase family protein [Afifella sp. H1R]MCF1504289.1 oligosaccharide flippase family protein [Afifella sp. H1R]
MHPKARPVVVGADQAKADIAAVDIAPINGDGAAAAPSMRAILAASLLHLPGRILKAPTAIYAVMQSMATFAAILFVNIVTGIITARLLGPDGRGIYSAVVLWTQFLALISTAGIGAATTYHVAKNREDRARIAQIAFVLAAGWGSLVLTAALLAIPHLMTQYDQQAILYARIAALASIFGGSQALLCCVLIGLGAFTFNNYGRLAPNLFYFFALMGVLGFADLNWQAAVLASIAGISLALVTQVPAFLVRMGVARGDFRRHARSMLSYSLRAGPADIVTTCAEYTDRLILIGLVAPAELGFYVIAFSFSRIAMAWIMPINSVLLSKMARAEANIAKCHFDQTFRFALALLLITWLAGMWWGPPLLVLLYGQEFAPVVPIFHVLLAEAIIFGLANISAQLFQALNRPGYVSAVEATCFAAMLVSVYVMASRDGALGAAWAILAVTLLRLTLILIGIKISLKLPLPRPYLTLADLRYLRDRLIHL